LPKLSLKPSEYFRRQCFLSADASEPLLPHVLETVGTECIVTASDFPHPEGTFPDGIRRLEERDDIPVAAQRQILWDNPRRLYGFPADS
jgi:predicted TIM-barrel fold metal-dependent hydrolase